MGKRVILTLALLTFASATSLHAQSSSAASPTMTLTVPQVASISVSNFTIGTSTNPGNFASSLQGNVTLNYTVRVPQSGSPNAKITVQSASTSLTAGTSVSVDTVGDGESPWFLYGSDTPPWSVPNDNQPGWNTTTWNNGPHVVAATLYTDDGVNFYALTTAGTLVTFAAGTKVNSGTATASFRITDSPTYDADTFTLPLTFTISSQ